MRRIIVVVVLALAPGAAASGVTEAIQHPDRVVNVAATVEDRLLGRRLKDAAITAVVKARLIAVRPASLTGIDVDTDEGVVRLSGTVRDVEDWAEAQRLAETSPGVRRVANQLVIEGPG